MTALFIWLTVTVLFIAFSNGANDNLKGVATLLGSETASYGRVLAWATATTFAGSLAAVYLAGGLVEAFSGKGLVPAELTAQTPFCTAYFIAHANGSV